MVTKITKRNYRQYYKEYYGIDFGKDMDVHHLDFNRDNNSIDNLLLIPKEVHNKFHLCSNLASTIKDYCSPQNLILKSSGSSYEVQMIKNYFDAIEEMEKWNSFKYYGYKICGDNRIKLL